MTPDIINKVIFYQWGKKPPKGSRFKGTMSGESLVGLIEYTEETINETDPKELIEERLNDMQRYKHIDSNYQSFWEYGTRSGQLNQTISSIGLIDSDAANNFLRQQVVKTFCKPGRLAWQFIGSFPSHGFAEGLGLKSIEDYAKVITHTFEQWYLKNDFKKENIVWWANVHVDTDNPHFHLIFTTSDERRKGRFSQKALNDFKAGIIKELNKSRNYQASVNRSERNTLVKQKNELRKELIHQTKQVFSQPDEQIEDALFRVAKELPLSGRLQINSRMKFIEAIKPVVYQVVDLILSNPEIKPVLEKFMDKVQKLDDLHSNRINSEITIYRVNEEKRLRDQVANYLLKTVKDHRNEYLTKYERIQEQNVELIKKEYNHIKAIYDSYQRVHRSPNPFIRLSELRTNEFNHEFERYVCRGRTEVKLQLLKDTRRNVSDTLEMLKENNVPFSLTKENKTQLSILNFDKGVVEITQQGANRLTQYSDLIDLVYQLEFDNFIIDKEDIHLISNDRIQLNNENPEEIDLIIHNTAYLRGKLNTNQIMAASKNFSIINLNQENIACHRANRYFSLNRESVNNLLKQSDSWEKTFVGKNFSELDPNLTFRKSRLDDLRKSYFNNPELGDVVYKTTKFENQERKVKQEFYRKCYKQAALASMSYIYKAQAEAERKIEEYLNQDLQH